MEKVDLSDQAHTSNLMEVDQSVSVVAEVVMPKETIYPVPASMQTGALTGVVEAVAEVALSSATNQVKFLGAGQLYEEGKHCGKIPDEDFEDVGGFSVQKTHASLYEAIWLKYGHIASNNVLTDFYESQVVVMIEVMDVIGAMNGRSLEEISEEVIEDWEKNIRVAEKLEFNIGWLREHFEDIKKYFSEGKKLEESLKEQNQAMAEVTDAEQQLVLAKQKLSALETKITPLLKGRKNIHEKCGGGLLLLKSDKNLSVVTAPVQNDAILVEEPVDNNSKTVRSKRIAKKRRLISSLNM